MKLVILDTVTQSMSTTGTRASQHSTARADSRAADVIDANDAAHVNDARIHAPATAQRATPDKIDPALLNRLV